MLAQSSEEHMGGEADIECLGVVPGKVKLMQVGDLRLPHMGWNQVLHDETHPLVITSYSIHYTKLYEPQLASTRTHGSKVDHAGLRIRNNFV